VTLPNTPGAETHEATTVVAPRLPRVNLMPPEIAEAAAFRRFQLAMSGAVVAAIVVVGALYVHEHSTVTSAKQQLADAQSKQTSLQNTLSSLSGVQDVYTKVAAKKAMLAEAMGSEIRWSDYLTDLSMKVPDNVWLTNVTATETIGPGVTTQPSTDPLATPGIGTVTFTGTAFSHDDVATWLDVLAKERGWADPYFTNSSEGTIGSRTVYNWNASVNLTPSALSGHYAPKTGT
jgi:Tfp pilus assembly protein PilN